MATTFPIPCTWPIKQNKNPHVLKNAMKERNIHLNKSFHAWMNFFTKEKQKKKNILSLYTLPFSSGKITYTADLKEARKITVLFKKGQLRLEAPEDIMYHTLFGCRQQNSQA